MPRKFALISLLCLSILLLAGCGYNGTVPTSTGSSVTVTAISAITPGPTGGTTPSPSTGPSSHSGEVTVQTSAASYHAQDSIVITISNGTSQTISFADHQSNCTIVLLQHQHATNWDSINPCRLMTLTRFLSLDAGKSTTVTLRTSVTAWQTGTYRVAFSYNTGQGSGTVAYSAIFQIS